MEDCGAHADHLFGKFRVYFVFLFVRRILITNFTMRFLVLGATGPAGILLVREALDTYKHCTVVIYARSPGKIPEDITSNKSIVIIEGQLDDFEEVSKALEGVHVVLSALGPSANHPANTPLAKGYSNIIAGMNKHGVKRLICLGTASIQDPSDKQSIKFALLVRAVATFAHNAYADIVAVGDTVRTEGVHLDWTIVRVPLLNDKQSKDVIAGYVGDGKVGVTLSRRGFAAFAVAEVEKRQWIGTAPLVCSA